MKEDEFQRKEKWWVSGAMEKLQRRWRPRLREALELISNTHDHQLSSLPLLERSLLPLLTAATAFYKPFIFLRDLLYRHNIIHQSRLAVPVISIGNVTWGGTGKTPMVEFLARRFVRVGITPLILTRGYLGGDEARLLQNLFFDTFVHIGVGPNRAKVAEIFLKKFGGASPTKNDFLATFIDANSDVQDIQVPLKTKEIGVVILDDGMQHRQIARDFEIVMVNTLSLWGNGRLIPRGPLRESLKALERVDAIFLHHADLVDEESLRAIRTKLYKLLRPGTILLHTKMIPQFFSLTSPTSMNVSDIIGGRPKTKLPLAIVRDAVLLFVSGIACPESLVLILKRLGALYVDHIKFSDHHSFTIKDICSVQQRVSKLKLEFDHYVAVVVSEKDYFRNPCIWRQLIGVDVLILHSSLVIMDQLENIKQFNKLLSSRLNCYRDLLQLCLNTQLE